MATYCATMLIAHHLVHQIWETIISGPQKTTFFDMVPANWFTDASYANVTVVLFASSVAADGTVAPLFEAITACAQSVERHPLRIIGLRLDSADPIPASDFALTYVDGQRTLHADVNPRPFLPGSYFLIASPNIKNGEGVSEVEAERAIAIARALLSLTFGHTAAEQRSRAFVLEKDRQRISTLSPVIEMHLFPDAFRFLPDTVLAKLGKRARFVLHEQRGRFATALTFVSRAINELDQVIRFSHLWMALEASTGGKPDRSLKRLQGSQSLTGVLRALNMIRNDLFHQGLKRQLPQRVERILFLAIAAEFLNLAGVSDAELHEIYERLARDLTESDLDALPN